MTVVQSIKKQPEIGAQMPDGSVYLGFHKSKHWFVVPEDAVDEHGGRLTLDFNQAAQYAKELKALGYNDWKMPDDRISQEMFRSKDVGAFEGAYSGSGYWVSSKGPDHENSAWMRPFSTGGLVWESKICRQSVRCVRSDELEIVDGSAAAALAEARLQTLKLRAPGKLVLKRS